MILKVIKILKFHTPKKFALGNLFNLNLVLLTFCSCSEKNKPQDPPPVGVFRTFEHWYEPAYSV
jgi:hypothetical protein